jgi:hypothetical protein
MIHGREFKLLIDLVAFVNRNSIKQQDIISAGAINNSHGVLVPGFYYIIFFSEKGEGEFEELPLKLTV